VAVPAMVRAAVGTAVVVPTMDISRTARILYSGQ